MERWDEERVRQRILRELGPATSFPAVASRLRDALSEELGDWYAAGPQVGGETISGWCWCHAFPRPFVAGGLEAVAEGVVDEVRGCLAWRRGLGAWLDERRGPRELLTLEEELVDLVGVLVGLGLNDAWYVHVPAATAWRLEVAGHPVPDDLFDQLDGIAGTCFTSWVDPKPPERASYARDAPTSGGRVQTALCHRAPPRDATRGTSRPDPRRSIGRPAHSVSWCVAGGGFLGRPARSPAEILTGSVARSAGCWYKKAVIGDQPDHGS